jgi:hypothetical protein
LAENNNNLQRDVRLFIFAALLTKNPLSSFWHAGIRMTCSKTTPEMLAEAVLATIGKEAQFKPIPIKGAQEAAKIIQTIL